MSVVDCSAMDIYRTIIDIIEKQWQLLRTGKKGGDARPPPDHYNAVSSKWQVEESMAE